MTGTATIIAVGCAVGVLSSAIQSVGLTLQRKASCSCKAELYRNTTWQMGLSLFLLSNIIGSTVQIATLPLFILAPLQSCGLLFNSLCAHYILKERSSWRTVVATLLILAGGTVIGLVGVSTSDTDDITHSLHELLVYATQGLFVRWFVATNLCVLLLLLLVCSPYVLSLSPFHVGLVHGVASGIWSAHALLLAKSISDIVTHTLLHSNKGDLTSAAFLVLVASFVSLSLTQLYLLNRALRHVTTSILYPLVFCVYNLITIFNGVLFFRGENSVVRTMQGIVPGVASLIGGVVVLSYDQYITTMPTPAVSSEVAEGTTDLHRRSVLSYTSLRPNSMDGSTILRLGSADSCAKQRAEEEPGSPDDQLTYVSLMNSIAPNKGNYGSVTGQHRKDNGHGKRVLTYEQEELLSQIT